MFKRLHALKILFAIAITFTFSLIFSGSTQLISAQAQPQNTSSLNSNLDYSVSLTAADSQCSRILVLSLGPNWSNVTNGGISLDFSTGVSADVSAASSNPSSIVITNQQGRLSIANLPESVSVTSIVVRGIKLRNTSGIDQVFTTTIRAGNIDSSLSQGLSSTQVLPSCNSDARTDIGNGPGSNSGNQGAIAVVSPVTSRNDLFNDINEVLSRDSCQGLIGNLRCVLGSELIGKLARNLPDQLRTGLMDITLAGLISSILSSAVVFNIINLAFFLRSPLLLYRFAFSVFGKKTKPWGLILDKASNKPVAFATLRLFSKASKQLMETKVSDLEGRYGFAVSAGSYYLEVEHPNYKKFVLEEIVLANAMLVDKDINLVGLGNRRSILSYLIPQNIKEPALFVKVKNYFFMLGVAFSIIAVLLAPIPYNLVILVAHLVEGGFILLAATRRPKFWGTIREAAGKTTLSNMHVKVYNIDKLELVDALMSNYEGRFGLILDKGEYYFSVEGGGYKFPSKLSPKASLIDNNKAIYQKLSFDQQTFRDLELLVDKANIENLPEFMTGGGEKFEMST